MLSNLNRFVHKHISHSQASSGSNTRSCSTTVEPNNCTKHGKIQEGSEPFFYVPKVIVLLVLTYRKTYSSHVVVIDAITTILTYFKSTLNPFLFCWKVKEVRQAVK